MASLGPGPGFLVASRSEGLTDAGEASDPLGELPLDDPILDDIQLGGVAEELP
ncbi:MAG: hypothetical protein U5R31_06055 [Acidimicrobiia bacterium]|nr:hypothetical protein [Acidimicrobiia bacterium]